MRIAFIIPSLAKKAPIMVVRDLVEVLISNGHDCFIFYLSDVNDALNFQCKKKKITFWSHINFDDFDIIHAHGLRPDIYVALHKPVFRIHSLFVSTIHCNIYKDILYSYNRIVALLIVPLWIIALRRTERIVVLNKSSLNYYSHFFSSSKLSVVYNTRILIDKPIEIGTDHKIILDFKGDSVLLGTNAFLSPVKGIDMVLRAMVHLPECKFCIVGDGGIKESLITLSKELGVYDRCLFIGYRQDAYRYIPYYDVYVMPSRSEGFPLGMLEAVIYKCPFLCSDLSLFKEFFNSDEVSFFELDNIFSLEKAIKEAYTQQTKPQLAYKRFKQDYSPDIFYNSYMSIYCRGHKF